MLRVTKKVFMVLETKEKRTAVILLFLMIFGAFLESLSVSLILPLITTIIDTQGWSTSEYSKILCSLFHIESQRIYIQLLIIMLIGIFVVKAIYVLGEYYLQYTFVARGRLRLQKALMKTYIRKSYAFYLQVSSGEVIRVITTDAPQTFELVSSLLLFYTESSISLLLAITVFVMSPQMTTGLLIFLMVEVLLIAKVVKPIMKEQGIQRNMAMAAANKWILQSINGIKSIKVSQTEDFFDHMYNIYARKIVDSDRKQQTLNNMPRLLIESITVSAVLIMVYVQIIQGVELANIVPQLSAFAVAAMRLLPSMNRISTSINAIPFYEKGLDNVIEVLTEDSHIKQVNVQSKNEKLFDSSMSSITITFRKSLSMEEVSFAYPGTDKQILKHASIEIYPGQSVGIVGSSGAGKTTLVDILLGLLKPQEGCIRVDDVNIEELPDWLKLVAYIPQRIFLMDGTIRENVVFGQDQEKIDDNKVWEVLREAQLDEFVAALPMKLDSKVGEQGILLSGGQCQRIGIARALYRNPDIIFLDEATSALDNETETAIMESIENLKGRKTLIIIAHRLTTIKNCDVVYRVEDGRILKER